MPTLGFHVPDDSPLKRELIERAKKGGHASVSAYVRDVVERELSGGGPHDPASPEILVELARRLLGDIDAEDMDALMKGRDQRRELKWLLKSFLLQQSEATTGFAVAEPTTGFTFPPRNDAIREKESRPQAEVISPALESPPKPKQQRKTSA